MWIEVIDKELDESRLVNLDYVSCVFPQDDGVHLVMSDGCVIISDTRNLPYDKFCEILTKFHN